MKEAARAAVWWRCAVLALCGIPLSVSVDGGAVGIPAGVASAPAPVVLSSYVPQSVSGPGGGDEGVEGGGRMRTPGVYNPPLPGTGYWAACADTGIRQVTGEAAVDGPWALHLTSQGGVVCRLAGEGGSLQEESAVAGMVFLSENYRF